ncbi:MAG: hypothetical protein GF307_15025, partial [candidate division Zixibacteria bacterium]|nr:hypothetical protein [candidate division Zixibacteria bacterium]
MKNHLLQLLLAVLIAGSFGLASAGEIDPGLEKVMESMTADQEISVLVYLNEQANIGSLTDQMDSERATLRRRHEIVVRSLQSVAENTQSSILSYLENEKANGNVFDYQAFWITNAIKVNAPVSEVKELAARPDVSTVYFNYGIELVEPVEVKESSRKDIANVEVGLYAVRADEVWAMGFDGTGVLVANMDTGVDGNHPAL